LLLNSFTDVSFSILTCTLCVNLWLLYHTHVNTITTPATLATDIKRPKLTEVTRNIYIIISGLLLVGIILSNYLVTEKANTQLAYWDMVYVSQYTLGYFFISIGILFLILFTSSNLVHQNISYTPEYLFFIVLITIASYLLIGSTNLLFAVFVLEFIALLIFGKFAVSRIMYTYNTVSAAKKSTTPQFSYGLFNSLFFQFWANFVSSILLFFSLVNVHYSFGLSNFWFLNFFLSVLSTNWYLTDLFISVIVILLTTGFFIKLGLSPYQFFKIETYKGVPLFMVIIYTTLYLSIYIYFFTLLFVYQVPMLREFSGSFIAIMLVFSILYLINLLFDTKNFKAFLSYSTLVTVINLFMIILLV